MTVSYSKLRLLLRSNHKKNNYMKKFALSLLAIIMLSGCFTNNDKSSYAPDSIAKPYEVSVVADPKIFNGGAGDSLQNVFETEIYMVSYSEKELVVYNTLPKAFTGYNRRHRNIIIFQVGEKYTTPRIVTQKNVYSKPQLITIMEAPDTTSLMQLITAGRDELKALIIDEELNRYAEKASSIVDVNIRGAISEMFDVSVNIPKGYKIRNTINTPDTMFMWVSYELPESSQGLLIYSYPYEGSEITNQQIVEARNKYVANVPGELDNSYMTTSDVFPPETEPKMIKGKEWGETRGFWRVANDYQGGPFVSYATVDEERKRVVVLDWYVYSPNPNKGQGHYLRQLEGIMETTAINK